MSCLVIDKSYRWCAIQGGFLTHSKKFIIIPWVVYLLPSCINFSMSLSSITIPSKMVFTTSLLSLAQCCFGCFVVGSVDYLCPGFLPWHDQQTAATSRPLQAPLYHHVRHNSWRSSAPMTYDSHNIDICFYSNYYMLKLEAKYSSHLSDENKFQHMCLIE